MRGPERPEGKTCPTRGPERPEGKTCPTQGPERPEGKTCPTRGPERPFRCLDIKPCWKQSPMDSEVIHHPEKYASVHK